MSQLHHDLTFSLTVLTRVASLMDTVDRDGRNLEQRIVDGYRGHPKAAAYDSDKVTASGTSDPTGNAAMQRAVAEGHHKLLRARVRDLVDLAVAVEKLAVSYTPRPATDKERREVDSANDPGCVECARTYVADGVARWEPVHVTATGKLSTCRWCYEWERSTGRKPTLGELEQHHSGRKVKRPA